MAIDVDVVMKLLVKRLCYDISIKLLFANDEDIIKYVIKYRRNNDED